MSQECGMKSVIKEIKVGFYMIQKWEIIFVIKNVMWGFLIQKWGIKFDRTNQIFWTKSPILLQHKIFDLVVVIKLFTFCMKTSVIFLNTIWIT